MMRWNLATRIGFRFVFSYFILFFFTAYVSRLIPLYFELWHGVVEWVAQNVFHLGHEILLEEAGISNTAYGWVLFLCYMALAAVATVLWSVLDRRRTDYERLYAWLRLLLRLFLAGAMISYGALKTIPAQMISPPPMGVLMFRIGDLFPNHLLWWTVGSSPVFETLTGLAELLGGVLLLVPRTTLLGSLVCAANMLLVFLLNMCYDVPVKLMSFHLLVMSVLLIAPDLRRLAGVFLFNRRVETARVTPLFKRKWLDRAPHVLLLLYGLYLIVFHFDRAAERYQQRHPPRPPLYGFWSVEEFAVDGKDVPMSTDPDRWRWVSFGKPGALGVELMIGSAKSYKLDLDMEKRTMRLDESALSFAQPETGVLILDGHLDGRRTRAKLRRMPLIREVPPPYKN